MSILLAIFLPPVYYATQKKWGVAAFMAFALLVSAIMFILLPFTWIICAVLAVQDVRKKLVKKHAEMIGQEVAKAVRSQSAAK